MTSLPDRFVLLLLITAVSLSAGCSDADADVVEATITTPALATVVVGAAGDATVRVAGRVVVANSRARVAAPLSARVRRVLVMPGDTVAVGTPVVEVVMTGVIDAAADLAGATARRVVVSKRQVHLLTLRTEGYANVPQELQAEQDLADIDATTTRARAVLRAADVGDAAVPGLLLRGGLVLTSPVAGVVAGVDAVVGAVVEPGATLVSLVAGGAGQAADRRRVVVRTALAIDDEALQAQRAASIDVAGVKVLLRSLAVVDEVNPRDGARDRWFAIEGDVKSAHALSDGSTVLVALPARGTARLPSSAVRLGGDGVAVVAVVVGTAVTAQPVVVLGQVDGDVLVDGVAVGVVVARDVRLALARLEVQ